MGSIDPVSNTLMMYAQLPTDSSQAHSFQVEADCLLPEFMLIPFGPMLLCEVSVAFLAPVPPVTAFVVQA